MSSNHNLTAEQIRSLTQGTTEGPWRVHPEHGTIEPSNGGTDVLGGDGSRFSVSDEDAALLAAAPELAATALAQAARIEQLEAQFAGMIRQYGVLWYPGSDEETEEWGNPDQVHEWQRKHPDSVAVISHLVGPTEREDRDYKGRGAT